MQAAAPYPTSSPIGDWAGEHVPKFLIETGFVYDSNAGRRLHTLSTATRWLGANRRTLQRNLGEPSDLLEIPLHWDTNDFAQFEFLGYYLNQNNPWFSPAPFHTPSQAHEIFTGSLDYCYDYVPGGVWYATMREVAEAWED